MSQKRSSRRHRTVVMPLGVKKSWTLEGDMLSALLAIDQAWLSETHLINLHVHALLILEMTKAAEDRSDSAARRHAQAIDRCASEIYDAGKPYRSTALQAASVRASASVTMPWLRVQSNHAIAAASARNLAAFDKRCAKEGVLS